MFSVLASKAKSAKKNKTGSWRSLRIPRFLNTNCIGCGLCKLVCPEACIEGKEKNAYQVDYEYCKGCGLCVYICPKKDIEMIAEKREGKDT